MSYDVFRAGAEEEGPITDYIGLWYSGKLFPQPIQITLNSDDESVTIDSYGEIGHGAMTCRSFNGIDLVLSLNIQVCSKEEADCLIEKLIPITDALFESYKERYDGQRYRGEWNEDLVDELGIRIQDFTSELFFDSEMIWDQ